MGFPEEDLALDEAILDTLIEIKGMLPELAGQAASFNSSIETFQNSAKELGARLASLTTALNQTKEFTVEVTVTGADGAIHDLVSRVLEEVMVRVRQENALTIL